MPQKTSASASVSNARRDSQAPWLGRIVRILLGSLQALFLPPKPRYADIIRQTRKKMAEFEKIGNLDVETKKKIKTKVRRHEIRLAGFDIIEERLTIFLFLPPSILAAFLIISPALRESRFGIQLPVGWFGIQLPIGPEWLGSSFLTNASEKGVFQLAYLAGFMFLFYQLYMRTFARPFRLFLIFYLFLAILSLTSITSLILVWAGPPPDLVSLVAFWLVSAIATFSALILSTLAISTIVSSIFTWLREELFPESVLVDAVLRVLRKVEIEPRQWTEISFKQTITARLEDIAQCVEKSMPRHLTTRDPITDIWLKETMSGIAAAVRSEKKWILTPKADTREQFLARMSQTLVHAALGDWDALPKEKPESVNHPRVWIMRLAELFRALVIGFLPLGVLALIRQTPLTLREPFAGYVAVAGVIWAIVSILLAIDPSFSSKLTAMKDIRSILPGIGNPNS